MIADALKWLALALVGLMVVTVGVLIAPFSQRKAYALGQWWSQLCLKTFAIKVEVIDENRGDYSSTKHLFVTLNQTSYMELFAGATVIPTYVRCIINFEYSLVPLVGWYSWLLGHVVIVRQWPAQAKSALRRAAQLLANKSNFWISIEGRRSGDGSLSTYKKGPVIMAIEAGAFIVPLSFHGAFAILPKGSWRPRPGKIVVTLHKKIPVSQSDLNRRNEIIEQLRAIGEASLHQ